MSFAGEMSAVSSAAGRRLRMVTMLAPRSLGSIRAVKIRATIDSEKMQALSRQFIPWIKYHNPKIEWTWDTAVTPVEEGQPQDEKIEVTFSDDSSLFIETASSFHQIAQSILDTDREKTVELVSSRQKKP